MRDYARNKRSGWSDYLSNNVVNKIIVVNVVVYVLQIIFAPHFSRLFAIEPKAMIRDFYFWQPVTYMFLHGGFMHLFFNMLMVWIWGSALEATWGGKRFLKYYVACGLGGALFITIFSFNSITVGASGAIFGLYLAYAVLFPNNYVFLYFVFPVKAKYLVTFIALFQLAAGVSGPSGISYCAHLGGMAIGLFFFRREIMNARWLSRVRRRWGDYNRTRREVWEQQEGTKIDSILDKIASKGYENLSTTEKRILENYSRKQKEESE
jgi:membrane associated rhomboid family serine protease